jgi:hypothetical protein
MNLDSAGVAHQRLRQRPPQNAAQGSRPRLAEHDLGDVLARRESEDLARIVAALQARRLPAQTLRQSEHLGEPIGAPGVAALSDCLDCDGRPVRIEAGGELARASHDALRHFVRPDTSQQALGSGPRAFDRFLTQIVDHLVVDPIGGAAQRQLAQRRQIAGSEEVLGRPPRRLRHINLAFVEALDELVGREVDKNDVGGRLQDPVRNGLAHGDAGDARDDIGEALEMLDVERRPHVDARVEQLLNVLPALGMAAVGRVGVGELVDDDQLGLALESGVEIELLERAPAIFNPAPRQDFEALDKRARLGAAMSLDEPNDDVDALLFEAPGVLQHGVGLTNAGRGAEKDLQPARSFPADRRQKRVRIGSSRVGSVGWGHRRSYVVMTILTHPAPNSAAKH